MLALNATRLDSRGAAIVNSQGRKPLGREHADHLAPKGRQYARKSRHCRPFGADGAYRYGPRGLRPWLLTAAAPRLRLPRHVPEPARPLSLNCGTSKLAFRVSIASRNGRAPFSAGGPPVCGRTEGRWPKKRVERGSVSGASLRDLVGTEGGAVCARMERRCPKGGRAWEHVRCEPTRSSWDRRGGGGLRKNGTALSKRESSVGARQVQAHALGLEAKGEGRRFAEESTGVD